MKPYLAALALSALPVVGLPAMANASYCSDGNTVTFAGLPWESGDFITRVVETILKDGYDCKTDTIPGNSVTLEQATSTNDIQIFAEEWVGRSEVWKTAVEQGTVLNIGDTIQGAMEGFFVPSYVIKGDAARNITAAAPDLTSVEQLKDPKIAALFSDPEEPSKGRFLNCPFGWTCEGESTQKLTDYGMQDAYVNFRPGSAAALDAAITSAYLQGQPILFYYWSPTAIMGKYDLVRLDAPEFSDECRAQIAAGGSNRDGVCEVKPIEVAYGVNAEFAKEAPEIIEVLDKASFPLQELNLALAYMVDNKADAATAAENFLKEKSDLWGTWVSPEAKSKIQAALQ
ncbi:ABC transporter substrate-binding protein [Paracoccus shanxieyensis]|uniref:Histidine ABC transporter substrate-binding protein n=1 Tax=Paracoccus shanxieyensis TaxID=2675752 RepID=A0A6L6IZJ8_9RHOB|nr:ABC transporter substrate-binding protein [Paracoccus shanxieyensis]MTH65041.1 histidine ABC transporter substrate-binding protein [Paracoccus shanxieyensis]MTH88055.1 histidine ABC transporter substrate-binding protein [Paracoccus shanxieyensis]